MQAFVTGGSGFVGGALIAALRRDGAGVRALARSDASLRRVAALGAEPVPGDLAQLEALEAGAAGCDVVYHSAAHVEDWGPPEEFHRVNVLGTENLLAAARRAGVRRFVHVSTEAVLVDGRPLRRVDESRPRPRRPIGLYPLTKGLAEERVEAAAAAGLEAVIVRPRLIWGEGDTSVLPKVMEAVRRGRFAWVDGGRYPTSTCHVDNVVAGLRLAAERGRPGQAYFLTDGEPVELRSFLTELLATEGLAPGERSIPRGLALALGGACELAWRGLRLRGAPPLTRTAVHLIGSEVTVDDTRARRELGYREVTSRSEGLARMRKQAARGEA